MIGAVRRFGDDRRGVTIVETALVMLPLTITLLALFDFGYRTYAQSVIEGTLQRASRLATVGDKTPAQIDDFVKSQLTVFSKAADPVITKKSYLEFSGVAQEETYTDTNNNGKYDPGECYVDENNSGYWDDGKTSGKSGLGGSDDIVFYTVSLTFPRMFPLGRFLGWSDTETVSANTVLRNQPYGAQAAAPACIS